METQLLTAGSTTDSFGKSNLIQIVKRVLALLLVFACLCAQAKPAVIPVSPTCGDMVNPVSVSNVSFAWKLSSDVKGACQTAYELWVGTTPQCNGNVWKSGKVFSEEQFDITLPASIGLQEGKRYYWKVRVWDGSDKVSPWTGTASFTKSIDNSWEADWIATGKTENGPFPYFRKTCTVSKGKVSRAVIYLCGLGCSQLFFNGKAVKPDRILDPAQTDYDKKALYSAFDVTGLLVNGKNCIGVMLGAGWYNQDKVWGGGMTYGKPILRCQMRIEYSSGKVENIGTDTSWKWADGPLVSSNVYQGDEYDATREIDGWCDPSFDDSSWNDAVKAQGVIPARMAAQEIPPMIAHEPQKAIALWRSSKKGNVWIYDFGTNLTSEVVFSASLPRGVRLQTVGSEEIYPDTREIDVASTGVEHVGLQKDAYTFAGKGKETWMPVFTYHGMRYVELTVEGSDEEPTIDWITRAPVHTDLASIGSFECSDHQINYLHDIAQRTFINSFVGVPVDCNQREKCGWLGDTHAYDRAADMLFQMNNFWVKYLDDIRTTSDVSLTNTLFHKYYNNQFYTADKAPGIPFMIAPGKRLCGVASPDWGTAVVQLPWHLYVYYGNKRILEDYYDMMSIWVRHIADTAVDGIVYEGLSDWCPTFSKHAHNGTDVEFSSSAFHLLDLGIMVKTARLLGKEEDLKWFESKEEYVRKAMTAKFFNPLKCSFGGQTANAMALELGLFPENRRLEATKAIMFDINTGYKFFDIGVFGLSRIGSEMSRNGGSDEVFGLFTKKGENSFGVMVDSIKVTTLWETLPMQSNVYGKSHGSHNHPMQGGYESWILEDVAGLRPVDEAPGFKTVLFHPRHFANLEWAKATVDTRYGVTSTSWKSENGKLVWDIVIPAGADGLVYIPEGKSATVDGEPIAFEKKNRDGNDYYVFPSGSYHIVAE
jgi:alpha-L-rhamnosidase